MFDRKFSRPPAELARQNFSTAGHANRCATEISHGYSHGYSHGIEPRIRATDSSSILLAAVKRSRRAQTVLGDRHDLVVRCSITSSVGRLRNSPGRIFQRLGTQTDAPRKSATDSSHEFEQHFVGSREKIPPGSDSPRRPTRSDL